MAAAALPGYCPVGYHLLYAALDGACFVSRTDDANPDGALPGLEAARQTEPADCHGFDTRAVLARAPIGGTEVEVVVEGSELAVYVVGEADGGGGPVTYRVSGGEDDGRATPARANRENLGGGGGIRVDRREWEKEQRTEEKGHPRRKIYNTAVSLVAMLSGPRVSRLQPGDKTAHLRSLTRHVFT